MKINISTYILILRSDAHSTEDEREKVEKLPPQNGRWTYKTTLQYPSDSLISYDPNTLFATVSSTGTRVQCGLFKQARECLRVSTL